jgi:hypothetical protein
LAKYGRRNIFLFLPPSMFNSAFRTYVMNHPSESQMLSELRLGKTGPELHRLKY